MNDTQLDKYYQTRYGITRAERDTMEALQSNLCAICDHPPLTRRLAVDHDHKYKDVKVMCQKIGDHWYAGAVYCGKKFTSSGSRKHHAIRGVRAQLKRASVRGLLCYFCNSGLRKYSDDPERMEQAAAYLRAHRGI